MEAIFKALADPARLTLMDSLRAKDGQSLSELETQLEMSRFGVMKHLRILEDAKLIITRKDGRFKYHYLNALPLQEAIDRWIEPYRAKPAVRAVLDLKRKLEGQAAMPEEARKPDFMMTTYIRCAQSALWSALSDPQQVVHYHFMAKRAEGALAPGQIATYFGADDQEMMQIEVTRSEPETLLDMRFHPKWSDPPQPSSRVIYRITSEGEHCRLSVEHYDIPPGDSGMVDGWHRLIAGLKTWLETGTAHRFASDADQPPT